MGLESATYINGLVETNPTSSDNANQGDNHLRLLKSTLKATFPNVAGAVTVSHTDLNTVTGKLNLTGGTLTGAITGTSAAFTGTLGVGLTSTPQGKMEIRSTSGGSIVNLLTLSNNVGASVGTGVALHFDPNGAGDLARTASIKSVQSTSGNYADLRFFTANSDAPAERGRFHASGGLSINNTTDPGTGNVSVTGTVTATTFSGAHTGNLTGNVTGNLTGAVTGNASTATALQTARTINGVSFNGTANISFGTDSVSEGATHLYFSTARARSAISVSGSLSYNSTTGVISYTTPVSSVAGKTGAVTLATSDISGLDTALSGKFSTSGGSLSGNLSVTGTITATGDITAFSDVRLKTNINTIGNALHTVKAMRGVTYISKMDADEHIGVIAQEVERVLPQVVLTHSDGLKSVAYQNIVAVLIEAVKELEARVAELENA